MWQKDSRGCDDMKRNFLRFDSGLHQIHLPHISFFTIPRRVYRIKFATWLFHTVLRYESHTK